MKYRIRHYDFAWRTRWTLQYHWVDENGGGWSSCGKAPFRWILRIRAKIHHWFYQRDVDRIGYREEFEL